MTSGFERPGQRSGPMTFARPADLLNVKEAAAYLRVCTKTLRTLIKKGALPCRQAGSQYRLLRRDLDNYLGLERSR